MQDPFMILKPKFYLNSNVVEVARLLIGKVLVTRFENKLTSGIIVETEAYAGTDDRASHAWNGKITPRNRVMFEQGGVAYVYLCYGIHSLFNVVTNVAGTPHAVLIRGIAPLDGVDIMLARRGKTYLKPSDGIGPGKVSMLLGIHYSHSGLPLTGSESSSLQIWIEDRGALTNGEIRTTTRIGVDYAGKDALLPYRFVMDIKKAPINGAF